MYAKVWLDENTESFNMSELCKLKDGYVNDVAYQALPPYAERINMTETFTEYIDKIHLYNGFRGYKSSFSWDYFENEPIFYNGTFNQISWDERNLLLNAGYHFIWSQSDKDEHIGWYGEEFWTQLAYYKNDITNKTIYFRIFPRDNTKDTQEKISSLPKGIDYSLIIAKCLKMKMCAKLPEATYTVTVTPNLKNAPTVTLNYGEETDRYIPYLRTTDYTITNDSPYYAKVRILNQSNGRMIKETIGVRESITISISPKDMLGANIGDVIYMLIDSGEKSWDTCNLFDKYDIDNTVTGGRFISLDPYEIRCKTKDNTSYQTLYSSEHASSVDFYWQPSAITMMNGWTTGTTSDLMLCTSLLENTPNVFNTMKAGVPFTKYGTKTYSNVAMPVTYNDSVYKLFYNYSTTSPAKCCDYNPDGGNNIFTSDITGKQYNYLVPCYKFVNNCTSVISVKVFNWDCPSNSAGYNLPVGYNTTVVLTNTTTVAHNIYKDDAHVTTLEAGQSYSIDISNPTITTSISIRNVSTSGDYFYATVGGVYYNDDYIKTTYESLFYGQFNYLWEIGSSSITRRVQNPFYTAYTKYTGVQYRHPNKITDSTINVNCEYWMKSSNADSDIHTLLENNIYPVYNVAAAMAGSSYTTSYIALPAFLVGKSLSSSSLGDLSHSVWALGLNYNYENAYTKMHDYAGGKGRNKILDDYEQFVSGCTITLNAPSDSYDKFSINLKSLSEKSIDCGWGSSESASKMYIFDNDEEYIKLKAAEGYRVILKNETTGQTIQSSREREVFLRIDELTVKGHEYVFTLTYEEDNSTIKIFKDNQWVDGSVYVYHNGAWVEGTPYVYKDGSWHEGA